MTPGASCGDPAVALFEATAEGGTRIVDAQLAAGSYRRAALFVDVVEGATPRGGCVLDYGCGAGRIAWLLARRGFVVLGAEPSPTLLRLAQAQDARGLRLAFRGVAPSDTSGLDAQAFDTIVCSSVIEFVPDPADLLRRLGTLLRRDGRLLLSYANRTSAWRRYAQWRFGEHQAHFACQRHVWHEADAWESLSQARFEKAGPTRFFESPFDQHALLRPLSRLRVVGTLGLVTARKGTDG